MNVDHQRALGNFGAKQQLEWNGQTWTFSWPGMGIISAMERACKQHFRDQLEEAREVLSADSYERAAQDYLTALRRGDYSGPNGKEFKAFFFDFEPTTGPDGEPTMNLVGLKVMMKCLLEPNHPDIDDDTILSMVGDKLPEVSMILTEMMPKGKAAPQKKSGV